METAHTTSARAFFVWLFLMLATLCSGFLAEHHGLAGGLTAVAAIMFIAAVKGRAVILHFMEIKAAPLPWRIAFEVWMWGVCGVIVAIRAFSDA
ncbi:cytochrome C oxidase subunit IV family protein [Burkholderia sp. Ac-20353]|uniref:cytochrome C oxidase subunit IV family protein n=1 Tax=Burkholderia sp. Ac-20353 TaxID=2703894 RepID=UPI00197C2D6D|nr:cytochrome C oxidase subunit IV family protein [Burkholderia sp. Ac-20353]MBN3785339.1 cytochrome C oxidase subunit IV family protein [Burkholderia sp. Ac-20353]